MARNNKVRGKIFCFLFWYKMLLYRIVSLFVRVIHEIEIRSVKVPYKREGGRQEIERGILMMNDDVI